LCVTGELMHTKTCPKVYCKKASRILCLIIQYAVTTYAFVMSCINIQHITYDYDLQTC